MRYKNCTRVVVGIGVAVLVVELVTPPGTVRGWGSAGQLILRRSVDGSRRLVVGRAVVLAEVR